MIIDIRHPCRSGVRPGLRGLLRQAVDHVVSVRDRGLGQQRLPHRAHRRAAVRHRRRRQKPRGLRGQRMPALGWGTHKHFTNTYTHTHRSIHIQTHLEIHTYLFLISCSRCVGHCGTRCRMSATKHTFSGLKQGTLYHSRTCEHTWDVPATLPPTVTDWNGAN